jgi:hypothetical protein
MPGCDADNQAVIVTVPALASFAVSCAGKHTSTQPDPIVPIQRRGSQRHVVRASVGQMAYLSLRRDSRHLATRDPALLDPLATR